MKLAIATYGYYGHNRRSQKVVTSRGPGVAAGDGWEHDRSILPTTIAGASKKPAMGAGGPRSRCCGATPRSWSYICLRLLEGADFYWIAKDCRTSVEMIEKHYAVHLRKTLDASAINVRPCVKALIGHDAPNALRRPTRLALTMRHDKGESCASVAELVDARLGRRS